jgi:hypothetical protein
MPEAATAAAVYRPLTIPLEADAQQQHEQPSGERPPSMPNRNLATMTPTS